MLIITRGETMKWRLIELHQKDPYFNTAIDDVISEFVSEGKAPPTIRFWKSDPAVSISYKQNLNDIDLERCKVRDHKVVRRISGGRADLISSGDLCYSIFIPSNYLEHNHLDVTKNYQLIGKKIAKALNQIGIDAELKNKCDIIVKKGIESKVGNLAQFIKKNVVVVHGKIRHNLDLYMMLSLFYCTSCKFNKHLLSQHMHELSKSIKSIKDYSNASEDQLYSVMRRAFTDDIEYESGYYLPEELFAVKKLISEKHKNPEWINGNGEEPSRGCCDEYWDNTSKIASPESYKL